MAHLGLCLFGAILAFFAFFPSLLQAQFTILSQPDDVVYVEAGKDLRLDVRFRYTGTINLRVTWSFNGTTSLFKDFGTNVQEQVSLLINSTSLRNNGTYRFGWSGSKAGNRNYVVIIQVQPVCNITCAPPFQISERENFSCGCLGVAGSPPPSASWVKDNARIGSVGYLQKQLDLFNVSKDSAGTYICRAQSGTLTCEKSVNLTVFYKPTNVSFASNTTSNIATVGDNVKLTCVADGNPSPNYTITFNETEVENASGILIIKNASDDDVGTYRCDAKNSLGNLSKQLYLNVKETPVTTTVPSTSVNTASTPAISTDTSTGTTSSSSGPKPKSVGGDSVGIIVGCVVAVLFLIVLIALMIWCFCRDSASRLCMKHGGGDEASPVNPPVGLRAPGENPYESVDGWKDNNQPVPGDEAGTSSSSNFPGEASAVPPVYAVVDKSKKEKKKEPKQDSLTYASLDPVALQPDSSKMRTRPQHQTDYASIDLDKLKKDQA